LLGNTPVQKIVEKKLAGLFVGSLRKNEKNGIHPTVSRIQMVGHAVFPSW